MKMLYTNENTRANGAPQFLELPPELLTSLLDYLPIRDLMQTAATCKRLQEICNHLGVWRELGCQYINFGNYVINESTSECPVKDRCRVAHNWSNGHCRERIYIRFKTGLLPCLQLTRDHLYISAMNQITRHRLKDDRTLAPPQHAKQDIKYTGHSEDVTKFVIRENAIISCSRDRQVMVCDKSSGQRLLGISSHLSSVVSIDATREVLIGGTNNRGVLLWSRSDGKRVHHIPLKDRVWSVRLDPSHRVFATGSSGNTDFRSLKLWDVETNRFLQNCGENRRKGAGIMDIKFESTHLLLSAGYDTYTRQWDIRTPRLPVMEFEEPSDNVVYCIASDDDNFIAAGSCRHGVVRFWDKRRTDACIQTFYVGGSNNNRSPVYSLQFNRRCLYAALSHSIYVLDFGAYKT